MKLSALPIRQKIGILLLIVTLGYTAVNHAVDRMTLRPQFLELERQQTLLDLKRCEEAIRREAYHLGVLAADWGAWDDTYEFVRSANQAFVDANLTPATFYDYHLDLIAMFNEEGRLVWGRAHDAVERGPLPLHEMVAIPLEPHLQCPGPAITRQGLTVTRHGAMVIATHPILTSSNEGPVRGTLVMGRLLCEPIMDELRAQTGIPFSIQTTDAIDEAGARIFTRIRQGDGAHLDLDDPYMLAAHSEMMDLSGNPAVVLSFTMPRIFMQKEREVMRSAFLGTLVGGLLILLCLLLLLSVVVIQPMQRLEAQVTAIGQGGGRTARLEVNRADEIGRVADEFNALLDRVEQDFNQREAATAALSASEKRLATLLDAAPNAVLMLDAQGRIETANPAAADLFGHALDALHGKALHHLLPDAALGGAAMDSFRGEVEAVRADGGRFPVYAVLRAFHLEGKAHRIAVVTDLTEFKRMHEAVLRAQHLASLGEMGATVAHELRNPVAGISNAVEILRDTLPADTPHRDTLDEMQRQARRVERTVRSLLDFARPWQVAPEPIAMLAFAQETWQRLDGELGGTLVTLEGGGDASATAMADPGLMEQVLRNIYENAIQAMGGTGHIRLHAANGSQGIALRIVDSGPGVPDAVRPSVFKPFFTTRTTGVGLGLAVCRTLVEAQGGRVDIANEPGAGAAVSIELPAGDSTP